jgi:hypothetical protein
VRICRPRMQVAGCRLQGCERACCYARMRLAGPWQCCHQYHQLQH